MFVIVCLLIREPVRADGTVTDCSEASLRAAMAGGGTVTFACDGTITLANTIAISSNIVIDGSGRQITISGDERVRVFIVNTNVAFTVSNLTIARGYSGGDQGAGICNLGGEVLLQNCTLAGNVVQGHPSVSDPAPGTNGIGGAVYNLGNLKAFNCSFNGNSAAGAFGTPLVWGAGLPGGDGIGGAVGNYGTLVLSNCWLADNSAWGGAGGYSGWGNNGSLGGDGDGGAIGNFGTLTMTACLLTGNSCTGGTGGAGGDGTQAYYPWNSAGGGGWGGGGNGGALFNNGSAVLVNDTIALNCGVGGSGANGGTGASPVVQGDTSGNGGLGGGGGSGYGAIYDASGQCYVTNCTIASNSTTSGNGGLGGLPGPYNFPGPSHYGSPGPNGGNGPAGGGLKTAGARLFNTLLSGNGATNCIGTIIDAGHNLSSDASCAFTGVGSLNTTDPKLGSLAGNGGPTWTMALLPGSPAIDAGTALGAPATDQRGISRPQGPGVDIGAFEYQYIPVFTAAKFQSATNFWLQACGLTPQQACTLQVSTNLIVWRDLANLVADTHGQCEFVHTNPGSGSAWFYRLKSSAAGNQ